jgi:hypothetical protein
MRKTRYFNCYLVLVHIMKTFAVELLWILISHLLQVYVLQFNEKRLARRSWIWSKKSLYQKLVPIFFTRQMRNNKPYKRRWPDLKCNYCHNLGHTIRRCCILHPELKPNFEKKKKDFKRVTRIELILLLILLIILLRVMW